MPAKNFDLRMPAIFGQPRITYYEIDNTANKTHSIAFEIITSMTAFAIKDTVKTQN